MLLMLKVNLVNCYKFVLLTLIVLSVVLINKKVKGLIKLV